MGITGRHDLKMFKGILVLLLLLGWSSVSEAQIVFGGRGGGGGVSGWPSVSTTKVVTWANSFSNALGIGKDTSNYWALYHDATDGLQIICVVAGVANECNYIRKLAAGKNFQIQNSSGTAFFTADEATQTVTIAKLKVTGDNAILLPLNPRGAASSALESIVTNQPSDYYLTVTAANTDAADFSYIVASTSGMIGATTATFQLVGVSKHATPSGNIDLDCALSRFAPGTTTFTAHVTTDEKTALLTPAVQNRPVAVTTASHTINGGALVAGDVLHGSCEVDATATTSAQMTDFRLWGWILVTFN